MDVPAEYYDEARERLAGVELPWDGAGRARDPRRPRPRRPPAPDLHRDPHRPAHRLLRDHPARGRHGLRRGQLQGAVRVHRAGPGPPGQPVASRMDGVPQWVRGVTSRQAHVGLPAGHRGGGARALGLLRAGQPPVPAPRRPPTGSTSRGRPPTTPTTRAGSTRPRRPVAHAAARQPRRCRSPGTATRRAAPSSSATPTATSCSSCTPGPGGCAPSTARSTTAPATTSSCPAARPTGSSRPAHRPAGRRGLRVARSSCPTRACSVATPCSTRPCIEVPEAEAVDEAGEFTVVVKRLGPGHPRHLPVPPVRRGGLEGRRGADADQRRGLPAR